MFIYFKQMYYCKKSPYFDIGQLQVRYTELYGYACTGLFLRQYQNTYKIISTTKELGQHLSHSFVQTPDCISVSQPSVLLLILKLKVFITKNTLHFYSTAHLVISKFSKTLIKPQKLLEDNETKYNLTNVSFISHTDMDGPTRANSLESFFLCSILG